MCRFSLGMAQNPGVAISEFLVNPAGSDSPFEWVELIATQNIDFAVTPYTIVVNNNGAATAQGWVQGGTISYAFQINTGTVNVGDVFYVGGTSMLPSGVKLRQINTGTTVGDGFGSAAAGGVFGNGGANADGIAVFDLPVASITNTSVPKDAIFYGTAIGTALVNGGLDGYQLPVNDRYSGGKLQSNSFVAGEPGSDQVIKATGFFNTNTNTWYGQRSWAVGSFTNDNQSGISLGTVNPPGTVTFTGFSQIISENAGTIQLPLIIANPNGTDAKVILTKVAYGDAAEFSDYVLSEDTITIPGHISGSYPVSVTITDDAASEKTERIALKLSAYQNVLVGTSNYHLIYIQDNDYQAPVANNELMMSLLTSFSNGAEGTNSAEIVTHDPSSQRLYIANSIGAKMDIVDFSNPAAPVLLNSISMTPYGNINSIAVYNGVVAVAMENANPQLNGSVVFFDVNGNFLNQVAVGAMPDMITFNKDYSKLLVACEGEPKTDYSIDPEGSVAIIDLTPGIPALTASNVQLVGFTSYNGQIAALRAQGIRIFGPGSTVAQDFEPEYIAISEDNSKAYVTLQENNAIAVIEIATGNILEIRPLGTIDYSNGFSALDPSDQTSAVLIGSLPAKGVFMPDAIATSRINGTDYLFTANEGDAREYTAVTDVARLSATNLDASTFPDQSLLKNNQFLGRLNVLQQTGDTDGDGDKDEIHLLGTRSFSIWNAQTGALVFDSKDLLEQITKTHPASAAFFNASNTSGAAVSKNRSDDKGPEPEGVTTAFINGNNYLFVSLERVGGVMIFNVDQPASPTFVGYYNNRVAASNGPDRGAEGIIFIKASESPNGQPIVILANEVSSTLSIFQVNTCVQLAGAVFTTTEDSICQGSQATLTAPGSSNSSFQWYRDNLPISSATNPSLAVTQAGSYKLFVSNSALSCQDTTTAQIITVLPLPAVNAGSSQSICAGTSVTLTGSGAQNYTWNNSVVNGQSFIPAVSTTYTVTGTTAFGCSNTAQVSVSVNPNPVVSVPSNDTICVGETITLTATGAPSLIWNNGVSNGVSFTPISSNSYQVIGTTPFGCTDTAVVFVAVRPMPQVEAGLSQQVCLGDSVLLSASGANTYVWSNGAVNGMYFVPTSSVSLTVNGQDNFGCGAFDQLSIEVLPIPFVNAGQNQVLCEGEMATFEATGAESYSWSNGVQNGMSVLAQTGSYFVTGIAQNGCSAIDSVNILVNSNPLVNLGNDTTICTYNLPLTLNAGAGFVSYNWNTNEQSEEISALLAGTYQVTVSDQNGCTATDMLVLSVDNCLGLTENKISSLIYPNPTSEVIHVDLIDARPAKIMIYSALGEIVSSIATNQQVTVIDLEELSAGMYTLVIESENSKEYHPIIIE